MATTKEDILDMINREKAQDKGITHVLIVCDTFDYEDYPVAVKSNENVWEVYDKFNNKNMQKVMEVYNMSMDIDEQLNSPRAFNF